MRVLVACEESQAVTIDYGDWDMKRIHATLRNAPADTRNGIYSRT